MKFDTCILTLLVPKVCVVEHMLRGCVLGEARLSAHMFVRGACRGGLLN